MWSILIRLLLKIIDDPEIVFYLASLIVIVLVIVFIILLAKFFKHLDYFVESGKIWFKRLVRFFWFLMKTSLKILILPLYLHFYKKKVKNIYSLILNRNSEKDHVEFR